MILGLSTAYSIISSSRQEQIAKADKERYEKTALEQRESQAVASFIKEMQPLLIEKGLRSSALGSEVRGVARGLTLAVLSQVEDSQRKRLIIRFLLDSGLNAKPGNLIDLSEADLSEADLMGANLDGSNLFRANLTKANLTGTYLSKANLSRADLVGADLVGAGLFKANLDGANLLQANLFMAYLKEASLREANLAVTSLTMADLSEADLSGAYLGGANLNGADLEEIKWDEETQWPDRSKFQGAKNIPEALKKQLGL